jgi:hypothetical protein
MNVFPQVACEPILCPFWGLTLGPIFIISTVNSENEDRKFNQGDASMAVEVLNLTWTLLRQTFYA